MTAETPGLLEIHKPGRAIERIEEFLRQHDFFDPSERHADGRCAEVYLGYGLSEPMRRRPHSAPPEPAPLPLAACRIHDVDEPGPAPSAFSIGAWQTTWSAAAYGAAVERARQAIAAGEVYQVNLVQHLAASFQGDPAGVAAALAPLAPRYPRALQGVGWAIASASPELFLARRGKRLWTMPIKGTRPLGQADALRRSAKDAAEHVMIVDLERNDLGQVAEDGSVRWPDLMEPRTMTGVEHLVSTVAGTVRSDRPWSAIIAAMFPGGSVTGAPKIAALDHIAALEPVGRGASMGALGTVWPNGDFDLTLTIRTLAMVGDRIHLWVGGGVVWDSDPESEVEESWVKARPLLEALSAASKDRVPA